MEKFPLHKRINISDLGDMANSFYQFVAKHFEPELIAIEIDHINMWRTFSLWSTVGYIHGRP